MSEGRRVGVLAAAQVAGGIGAAVGIAAGSLLAAQVSGSRSSAGLAQTATVLGAALLAGPVLAATGYPGLTVVAVLPLGLTLWCLAGARSAGSPARRTSRRAPVD